MSERSKSEKASETKRRAPIPQQALRRAEEVRNHYRLTLPARTDYRDLFNEYAAEVAGPIAPFLTRGDTIEVVDEAGSMFALLFLQEHVPGKIVLFVELLRAKLSGEAIDDMRGSGEFRSAWGGWDRRYCLVRPSGGVAREGMRTREEAEADARERNRPIHHRQTLG